MEVKNSTHIVVRDFIFKSKASTFLKIVGSTNTKVVRNDFDHSTSAVGGAISQSALITSAYIIENESDVVTSATTSDDIEIAYNKFHDHLFTGNNGASKKSGSFIKTQVDDGINDAPIVSKRLHIHHNHFNNIAPYIETVDGTTPAGDSDREAIVLGIASVQTVATNHLVEYNLFENCDGENEIITVKTAANTLRYNTFKNSMGSLSVRFGFDTEVYGNYFFGEGASTIYTDPNYQTGGIRIYGLRHKIYNNYMQNLTGTTWRQPILLDNGDTDGTTGDKHQRPQNVEIVNNTLVNNLGSLAIGSTNYTSKPKNNKIANNLVVGNEGTLMFDIGESSNVFEGNIAYATGSAILGVSKANNEVLAIDPLLQDTTINSYSIKQPGSASPVINASTGSYSYITQDINGVVRNLADVGAFEYAATPLTTLQPLAANDVGPQANSGSEVSSSSSFSSIASSLASSSSSETSSSSSEASSSSSETSSSEASSSAGNVTVPTPVAEWKFEDLSFSNVISTATTGLTVTDTLKPSSTSASNNTFSTVNGIQDKAVAMNPIPTTAVNYPIVKTGTFDYGLGGSAGMTFETWINPTTLPSATNNKAITLVSIASSSTTDGCTINSGAGYSVKLEEGGIINFTINKNGSVKGTVASITPIVVSNWQHIVATYNKTEMRIYINGNLENTTAYTEEIVSPAATPRTTDNSYAFCANFKLFGTTTGAGANSGNLQGSVDEVRLYNVGLTEEQVEARYDSFF